MVSHSCLRPQLHDGNVCEKEAGPGALQPVPGLVLLRGLWVPFHLLCLLGKQTPPVCRAGKAHLRGMLKEKQSVLGQPTAKGKQHGNVPNRYLDSSISRELPATQGFFPFQARGCV